MKWFRPYRWGGRLLRLTRRAGLEVRPLLTQDLRFSGATLRWREEGVEMLRGGIVTTDLSGDTMRLFVTNDIDVIQQEHRKGRLYEPEELSMIASYWDGGTFLDVGANVGNHVLYATLVLGAERVIAVEPQELAATMLEINVALNNVADRVVVHRIGLSDSPGRAGLDEHSNNLGATRLTPSGDDVVLMTGDELLGDVEVDFIKIDVEGAEMRVLDGLSATIERDGPPLLVEVEVPRLGAFEVFCRTHGYHIVDRFQRYDTSINLLATQSGRR